MWSNGLVVRKNIIEGLVEIKIHKTSMNMRIHHRRGWLDPEIPQGWKWNMAGILLKIRREVVLLYYCCYSVTLSTPSKDCTV